jgi:dehydrogenase/reductase SDR family protein 12
MRTLEEGADTITWLGLQPNAKLQSGEFYFDRKVAAKHIPGCGMMYAPELVETVVSKVRSLCGLSVKTD